MSLLRGTSYVCKRCARRLSSRSPPKVTLQSSGGNVRKYSSHVLQQTRGPRVAVVGSGPAGFYAASRLISKVDDAQVDMYEKLPAPFGLVRYGVAPDHPEVKNCEEKFTEVARNPRFSFIGNISLGYDLPLAFIIPHYDAILFAYGASKDKQLSIIGEDLVTNLFSARAFVGWYNGLPEYQDLRPILDVSNGHATIIGHGNVALDIARILLSPIDHLAKTDISEQALSALSASTIRHVRIVGRRGPLQSSFTTKELRELINLPDVHFNPIHSSLFPDPETVSKLPRAQKRLLELLHKGSTHPDATGIPGKIAEFASVRSMRTPWIKDLLQSPPPGKSFSLNYLLSPRFLSGVFRDRQVGSANFQVMGLPPAPECWSPSARVEPIFPPSSVTVKTDIAFRSIGYLSEPMPGFDAAFIPFDENRGIIPTDAGGRVVTPARDQTESMDVLPGFYCTGWVKNGPTGTIATTMMDAFSVADEIAKDWNSTGDDGRGRKPFLNREGTDVSGWAGVQEEADRRGLRRVSWSDWEKIDRAERDRGKRLGKEREKFLSVREMLDIL